MDTRDRTWLSHADFPIFE